MKHYRTGSSEETKEIARKLAAGAKAGSVYALVGDLGAGKTVFAKGFAEGLGVEEAVTSPTFTIVCEYAGDRIPLYHFDVYRIEDEEELFEIGFDEYLYGQGVCLIEWADRIRDALPEDAIIVVIEREAAAGSDSSEAAPPKMWRKTGVSEDGEVINEAAPTGMWKKPGISEDADAIIEADSPRGLDTNANPAAVAGADGEFRHITIYENKEEWP